MTSSFWHDRIKASSIHLGISLGVAFMAATLVFGLWYPYPYREISGGRELFQMVVLVDVILGPLITLAIFNRTKPRQELRRDLMMVGLIQLIALGYGLWTVFLARPIHLVFEYDRFRVVHAVDVPTELLKKSPASVDALPLMGPTSLSLRSFRDSNEKMEMAQAELQGLPLSAQPDFWQPYSKGVPEVLKAARPAVELRIKFADRASEIDRVIKTTGRTIDRVVYLPMVGRQSYWTAFLDPVTAEVLVFMPLDPF